ncbi:MFS transporter [Azoarcus sp. TTM-91]|nr:MFS transporter [Azoarcus sp. TTM-91]NMG36515.1 MFS transporter [Azoarcus sp. TTM-91]
MKTNAEILLPSPAFNPRPLMLAYMSCTMAMMAFVALIGPMARVLRLAAWQAGTVVTVGGVLWMVLARAWGSASDRLGRRSVLLMGVGGFMLSYWAMCGLLLASLELLPAAALVFAGLLLTRGAVGGFFAAIPSVGQALVADHVSPAGRTAALAGLGAANAIGLVLGPALAAALTPISLGLPLYVTAALPLLAFVALWRGLPRSEHHHDMPASSVRLADPRLRRPMAVAFAAMFSVSVGQISVGFFAIDRLGLPPEQAARAAGLALTLVGVGLILAQMAVRRLKWDSLRLIRVGAAISGLGFGAVALADSSAMLAACYFVAAAGMGWVFPAFAALASNAVSAHEQGATAGSLGAAQGLGLVLGPVVGTLFYELGPGVPYAFIGLVLILVAAWPVAAGASVPAAE